MSGPALLRARIEPYDLPFAAVWRTARGRADRRRGACLLLEDEAGRTGIGECAPLLMAGTESPDAALAWLETTADSLVGRTALAALDAFEASAAHPAASCAAECALLDLVSTQAGRPMRDWLTAAGRDRFRVNASLGALDRQVESRARSAIASGYEVLKIKLGSAPADRERAALAELASTLPAGVRLRLDANGAWDETEARQWVRLLREWPIESLEEPLRQPSLASFEKLQGDCDFPLALDESLPGLLAAGLPDRPGLRRAVLKPAVLGGARRTLAVAGRLRAYGTECVVTTTLEAAPGRWLVAQCAAALDGDLAHGLDTGSWLAEDLGDGPPLAGGWCRLPRLPGLGFPGP
jgi:o-succinylbenzoate synthase